MEIFIGNLPAQATIFELMRLLEGSALKSDYRCFLGRDGDEGASHYFVAQAPSRSDGLALIAKLNGQLLGGRPIVAREHGQPANCADWHGMEQRVGLRSSA